jgi:hypothetical protein
MRAGSAVPREAVDVVVGAACTAAVGVELATAEPAAFCAVTL